MKPPPIESRISRHTLFQHVLPLELLSRTLRVQPGEGRLLVWVTAIQLVMSASSILINNTAQATFLKRFGVDALPMVFLSEALITFVAAGLVGMLMERYRSLRVFTGLLLFYGIAAAVIRIAMATPAAWVYPLLYILKSQAVSILPILYWDILGDLFSTRQSKRLYTLITAGGVLGTAAGSLSTHAIAGWIGTENILLLFTIGMGLAALLNALTDRVAGITVQPCSPAAVPAPARGIGRMAGEFIAYARASRLLRYMIVLLAIPNMLLPILDYQFNVLVDQHFAGEAAALRFFGLFRGISNALIFLCLLVSSRLMSAWGVPISLLFHPVNYAIAFTGILLRFDILAGIYARFTTEMLKNALNNPARAILYNFFPDHLRAMVRVILRGGVVRLSDFAGSGLLIVISGVLSPRQLSLVAVPLAMIWAVTSWRLKRAYPDILIASIAEQGVDLEPMGDDRIAALAGNRSSIETLKRGITDGDGRRTRHCAQLLAAIKPPGWLDLIIAVAPSKDAQTQRFLLSLLRPEDVRAHLPRIYGIVPDMPPGNQWIWLDALTRLDAQHRCPLWAAFTTHDDPRARLAAWVGMGRCTDPGNRKRFREHVARLLDGDREQAQDGLKLAAEAGDPHFQALLLDRLTRSAHPETVGLALDGLSRIGVDDFPERVLALVDNQSPHIRLKALDHLLVLGDRAPLERIVAMLEDAEPSIRERAAAFIKTRGPDAAGMLLQAMTGRVRRQRIQIVRLMEHLKVPAILAARFAAAQLHQARRYLDLAWAVERLPCGPAGPLLRDYLVEKMTDTIETILYAMGSMAFGKRAGVLMRAIASERPRERDKAVEAVDDILHGPLRRRLLPFLEGQSLDDKRDLAQRAWPRGGIDDLAAGRVFSEILGSDDPVLTALGREAVRGMPEDVSVAGHLAPLPDPEPSSLSQYRLSGNRTPASIGLHQAIGRLRALSLFQGVMIGDVADVAQTARWVVLDPEEALLHAHSPADHVFILVEGTLRCTAGLPRQEWGPGDVVAEQACFSGATDHLSVHSPTGALLLAMPCGIFQYTLLRYPTLALNLCAAYSRMIRRAHRRLECAPTETVNGVP